MGMTLITAPTVYPVTRDELSAWCSIDYSDSDEILDGLVAAVTAYLDGATGILGRALEVQTWDATYDAFPCEREIELPLVPLISVTGVYYLSPTDGLEATFSTDDYSVDLAESRIALVSGSSWPTIQASAAAVRIRFVCGHARSDPTVSTVPWPIRQAIMLMAAHLYNNREATVAQAMSLLPLGFHQLISPHRQIAV